MREIDGRPVDELTWRKYTRYRWLIVVAGLVIVGVSVLLIYKSFYASSSSKNPPSVVRSEKLAENTEDDRDEGKLTVDAGKETVATFLNGYLASTSTDPPIYQKVMEGTCVEDIKNITISGIAADFLPQDSVSAQAKSSAYESHQKLLKSLFQNDGVELNDVTVTQIFGAKPDYTANVTVKQIHNDESQNKTFQLKFAITLTDDYRVSDFKLLRGL